MVILLIIRTKQAVNKLSSNCPSMPTNQKMDKEMETRKKGKKSQEEKKEKPSMIDNLLGDHSLDKMH